MVSCGWLWSIESNGMTTFPVRGRVTAPIRSTGSVGQNMSPSEPGRVLGTGRTDICSYSRPNTLVHYLFSISTKSSLLVPKLACLHSLNATVHKDHIFGQVLGSLTPKQCEKAPLTRLNESNSPKTYYVLYPV